MIVVRSPNHFVASRSDAVFIGPYNSLDVFDELLCGHRERITILVFEQRRRLVDRRLAGGVVDGDRRDEHVLLRVVFQHLRPRRAPRTAAIVGLSMTTSQSLPRSASS